MLSSWHEHEKSCPNRWIQFLKWELRINTYYPHISIFMLVGFTEELIILDLAFSWSDLCLLKTAEGFWSWPSLWGRTTRWLFQETGWGAESHIISHVPYYLSYSRSCEPSDDIESLLFSALFGTQSDRFLPILFMETGIRRASKQTRALSKYILSTRSARVADFLSSTFHAQIRFQKGPETSNPLLRTKDNNLSCVITCVSREKGDSPGRPPPHLWDCPVGTPWWSPRWNVSLFPASRKKLPGWNTSIKQMETFWFLSLGWQEIAGRQEKKEQKRNKVFSDQMMLKCSHQG